MKSLALPSPKRILHDRSILFNLAFFAYLIFLQPQLIRRLVGVKYRNRIDLFLGGLLLVSLAELAAVILKTPAVAQRLRLSEPRLKTGLFPFIIWIFHTVVGVSLAFFPLQACGLDISSEKDRTLFSPDPRHLPVRGVAGFTITQGQPVVCRFDPAEHGLGYHSHPAAIN